MTKFKRDIVVPFQRGGYGHCEHAVKVTRIGKGWNVRIFTNGNLNQEDRVYSQEHIGPTARDMLRWEDKMGNWSGHADNARHRTGRKEAERHLTKILNLL